MVARRDGTVLVYLVRPGRWSYQLSDARRDTRRRAVQCAQREADCWNLDVRVWRVWPHD